MYIFSKPKKVILQEQPATEQGTIIQDLIDPMPGASYLEMDQLMESEIQVLTAEDVKTELNDHSGSFHSTSFETEEVTLTTSNETIAPAVRGPSGEIIFLQRLKKVKKPKKEKSPRKKS